MLGQQWADLVGWLTRDRVWLAAFEAGGFFFVLLLMVLPLWLRLFERGRGMRRRLAGAAFAAHAACAANVDAVARQLFRDTEAPPLARLSVMRGVLERQRADTLRLQQGASVFSAAVDARLGEVLTDALALCERTGAMLAELVRLYLKEATVRLASNVVHGEDFLGFEHRRIVSLHYLAELEVLADGYAAAAAGNLRQVGELLGRGGRRRLAEARGTATQQIEDFRADVAHFCGQLQPADPESTEYRNRDAGERTSRTLDGLIARFDRAPGR